MTNIPSIRHIGTIIAKKVTLFLKNGTKLDYTHVTNLRNIVEEDSMNLLIDGETNDSFGARTLVWDRVRVKDIHAAYIEFHIPKE